jgi:hypothetical protein
MSDEWIEAKALLLGGCSGYHHGGQSCFEPGYSPDFSTMCRHVGKMYQNDPGIKDFILCLKHNSYVRRNDV